MIQQKYRAFDAQGRRKYLTRQEGWNFLSQTAKFPDRQRLLCETLYFIGCRPSELVLLKPTDLDPTEAVISVLCLKKRGKIVYRRIPIPESLAKDLRALQPVGDAGCWWPVSRVQIWRVVTSAMKEAGIEKGIHHCPKGLRHGFGVRAAEENVPLNLIQRWMGHSDSETTAIYLDVKDKEEREFMRRTWVQLDLLKQPG